MENKEIKEEEKEKIDENIEKKKIDSKNKEKCNDKDCPIHGYLKVRGRKFEGYVIKKFPRRIVIEFERTVYIKKYERYLKKKTRLHARLPKCMEEKVKIGDYVLIQECRPLSKIIHFVLLDIIKEGNKK
ncbi:MAG: 30S ribosomal protein S17 [Candidatus Pacearchaeota archaeon]